MLTNESYTNLNGTLIGIWQFFSQSILHEYAIFLQYRCDYVVTFIIRQVVS